MKEFVKKYYKEIEIVLAVVACLIHVIGMIIEPYSLGLRIFPFLLLLIFSLLNSYTNVNVRVLVWIMMGIEFICVFLSRIDLYRFYPYAVRYILDMVIPYDITLSIIIWALIFLIYLIPFVRKEVPIVYAGVLGIIYIVAAIYEGGISIVLFSYVIYYITFIMFCCELNSKNQLGVYEIIFDKLIEKIIDEDDDFDDTDLWLDDIQDDSKSNEITLLQKFLEIMEEAPEENNEKNWKKVFKNAIKTKKEEIVLNGSDILIDDLDDASLVYHLEYDNEVIRMSAMYSYEFQENVSSDMLKKKSVLAQTFRDIGFAGKVAIELNVDNFEVGVFAICLPKMEYSKDETEKLADDMFEFAKNMILIHNTEMYLIRED